MGTIPGQEAVTAFFDNAERFDDFINKFGTYKTSNDIDVETIPSFIDRKDGEIQARFFSFRYRGAWQTSTSYAVNDYVIESGVAYLSVVAHVSGTFATDLSDGKLVLYSNTSVTFYQTAISNGYNSSHIFIRNTNANTATRIHVEPNGYPVGTTSKFDLMFDPYQTDQSNYRIINLYAKTYDPDDSSTTQGDSGVSVLNVKGVGDFWGVWPSLHVGFSDDGINAVPMKMYLFDTSDTQWRIPMIGRWREGISVNVNDYCTASNHIYKATSTGTTGSTVPTHTSGIVTDGLIDWQFIRDVSASASYVKPCVVFGDRDQMPKFGYTNVRVQFAMDTLHWNNTSATFLGSGANRYWKINARIGTNDLYIMDETGTMFMRFNPDSKFRQNSNLAKLISGKAASDGDTTPDVSGTESLLLSNTATTSITRFDGTLSHQIFMVEAQDDNTTLVNGTNLVLANGDNLKLKTGDVVQFKVASNGTTVKQIKVKSHLRSTTSYNPPSLTTLTRVSTNITVTGAELADFVKCSFSIDLQGVILYAYVSAVDTVTVNFFNATTGTIDLGSGTIKILIDK